ncbi:hypothetical protein KFK09_002600 [Dendrobium nobile]|uniref:Transcription repressor n=1 Tax=Dendrobium nobile TaxID=94219 RepID=A0A8T3C240_DENNO|nr:hypothetical protein KFK09_002600 [Dendrobium nobile]
MGRKLPFNSLLFSNSSSTSSSSSPPCIWPSCSKPRTDSFRVLTSPLLTISNSLESSAEEASESFLAEKLTEKTAAEVVLDGLRSDRLFFDPSGGETRSITSGFDGGVAVAMESTDPYRDFRASMEEMVEAHGDREWEWLQNMLVWFLRANGKGNHGLIVGAFLDLLVGFGASSPSFSSAPNDKNPLCSSCSSNSSYIFEIEEVGVKRSGNG